MAEHRLVSHSGRKTKRVRGAIRGGSAFECSCGRMTMTSDLKAGIAWHAAHRRDALIEDAHRAELAERADRELEELGL